MMTKKKVKIAKSIAGVLHIIHNDIHFENENDKYKIIRHLITISELVGGDKMHKIVGECFDELKKEGEE